jgi:hypothetical protein
MAAFSTTNAILIGLSLNRVIRGERRVWDYDHNDGDEDDDEDGNDNDDTNNIFTVYLSQ